MVIAGDQRLRCRKCEYYLSNPQKVKPEAFGIVKNKHGAVVRKCMNKECNQFWLGYVQELPNCKMKIILKMIDNPE